MSPRWGFQSRWRRLPTKPPTPTSSVLNIGPTGVCNVFTAIRTAQAKPTVAPSATAIVSCCGIQFTRADIHAPSQLPESPPMAPPANRTRWAISEPRAEPTAAPSPAAMTRTMNTPADFITKGLTNRGWRGLAGTNRGPKREVEDEDDFQSRWRMSCSQVMDSVWAMSTSWLAA
jgi:hypothetical protein